jgi:hypothetical protein
MGSPNCGSSRRSSRRRWRSARRETGNAAYRMPGYKVESRLSIRGLRIRFSPGSPLTCQSRRWTFLFGSRLPSNAAPSDNLYMGFTMKPFLAVCMFGVASLGFGQAAVPLRDDLVAATRERIRVLDGRFVEIGDAWQKQFDAANCRVSCPPELIVRLSREMDVAMDVVMSQIHAEVEGFVMRTADTRQRGLNRDAVAQGLRQILSMSDEPRPVFVLTSANRRSLIVAYVLNRGYMMTPNGTSVAIRAYNETTSGISPSGVSTTDLRLSDVAGEDMNGYAGLSMTELHSSVAGKLFLLLSGEAMGANGPNTRMRIYEYDGEKFRAIWMPENIWGRFSVRPTDNGFTVEGYYYRDGRKRRDGYALYEDGSGLVLLDPESVRA